jgi:XTP/dITP diphosphohydrolase
MKRLIVASNNANKINEIKQILEDFPIEIFSIKEVGIDVDVEENGNSFEENAYIKSSYIYNILIDKKDTLVMSDDSGLEVEALGGAPGIYSARFAGEHGNDKKNNDKLLSLLENKEDREAKFVCVISVVGDNDINISVRGEVPGIIAKEEEGENGFGYDPLFYIPQLGKTFANLSSEQKNNMSHRGKALRLLKEELKKFI